MLDSEVMSLMILSAVTIVGIMIAVNAQTKFKMAFSWLLAVVLLTGNVIVVGSYLKSRAALQDEEVYNQRLSEEKNGLAASLAEDGESKNLDSRSGSGEIEKTLEIIRSAQGLAESLASINLDDYALSEEQRKSVADSLNLRVEGVSSQFEQLQSKSSGARDKSVLKAMGKLGKAALYCKLYYESADSDQEGVREKVMRTSAVAAKGLFQKANRQLVSMK